MNFADTRGARPIQDRQVIDHYHKSLVDLSDVSLDEYTETWREWISYSEFNSVCGLDGFAHAHYSQGTTQTFDHFVIRNRERVMCTLPGEFQYHNCISKRNTNHRVIDIMGYGFDMLESDCALLISYPFSDFGSTHPRMCDLLDYCDVHGIPVCLDMAYYPIARNLEIDFNEWQCIEDVAFSLSKAFALLDQHRAGVRFSRKYHNDGVCMINESRLYDSTSMQLGAEFMRSFSPDYAWKTYGYEYERICYANSLMPTDTVIFGLGDGHRHADNNRGVPGNYRVCISEQLENVV